MSQLIIYCDNVREKGPYLHLVKIELTHLLFLEKQPNKMLFVPPENTKN